MSADRLLPPEREVDCACDVWLERPVLLDPTGRNTRATACLGCGRVELVEALVEEPHPHDVRCVANRVLLLDPEALAWLSRWPRRVSWETAGREDLFLEASLRLTDRAALRAAEEEARASQLPLDRRTRLTGAGVPASPPPPSLPGELDAYAGTWRGLQLTAETPLDELVAAASRATWAAPWARAILARRPDLGSVVASLAGASDRARWQIGLDLLPRALGTSPQLMEILVTLLEQAEADDVHALLDVVVALGPGARPLAPVLEALAHRLGQGNYYLHKRVVDLAKKVAGKGR